AAELVDEEIASHALAVVFPAAPAEEAGGVERAFGCIAQPRFPVDGFGTRVGRDGVDPCAGVAVAVGVTLDKRDLSKAAGLHNLGGLLEKGVGYPLAAGLKDALVLLDGFNHGKAVSHVVAH